MPKTESSGSSVDEELSKSEAECSKLFKKVKSLEQQLDQAKRDYSKASTKLKNLKQTKCNLDSKEKIKNLNENIDSEWIDRQFPWSDKLKSLLKEKFNFDSFRPKQLAAINATLSKKDVLLVMPTGGGKSLVYQLPALVDSGFTLVVSPLISLIQDQLMSLKKLEIKAASINSATPKAETKKIYEEMADTKSDLKLLYVTPEWLAKSKRFMANLKKSYEVGLVARVAIDEVHCCSAWGHDFRPDYGYLGILRPILASVPFIGLTATATMSVLTDVQTMLSLEDCMIITAPFNRPNLFYEIRNKPSSKEEVLYLIESECKPEERGIIYTTTINDCVNLSSELRTRGLKVAPYHAQLEPDQKKKIHEGWIDKRYQVIVATVAFGMGIDQPDVRFVIHHSIPRSMESFYQESGRAGRDGLYASCLLLFSLNDYLRILGMVSSIVEEKKALSVLEYCLDQKKCRRSIIATHFEEVWDESHCDEHCDNCTERHTENFRRYDLSKICDDLHSVIDQANSNGEKLTLNKLMDGWFQTGPKKLRICSLDVPQFPKQMAEFLVAHLVLQKYLSIDKGYNTYSTICYLQKGKIPNGAIEIVSKHLFLGLAKIQGGPTVKKRKLY